MDVVVSEETLQNMCFQSLSECSNGIYGANGKGETVPGYDGSEEGLIRDDFVLI